MRLPFIPTLLVGAAVALMVGLGIWQLQRAEWKEGLLAQYRSASSLPPVAWPTLIADPEPLYYRRATGFCLQPVAWNAIAGRNPAGEFGWTHIASCRTGAEGPGMEVQLGWSKAKEPPAWRGGEVSGVIAPDRKHRIRLVAAPSPAPGLQPSPPPSPENVPNNHFFYAVQWFLFALTALIIYAVALRRRAARVAGPPEDA